MENMPVCLSRQAGRAWQRHVLLSFSVSLSASLGKTWKKPCYIPTLSAAHGCCYMKKEGGGKMPNFPFSLPEKYLVYI